MLINKNNYPIERIEKQGDVLIKGIKSCKSFKKALETLIGQQYKRGNTELEFYTRGLLELYKKYHPEKNIEVEVDSWKGKSSIEVIKLIDKIIIIKYQKKDKDSEPERIETEVQKEEIRNLILAIEYCNEYKSEEKRIKTRDLALRYCINSGIRTNDKGKELMDGNFWTNFFAWRRMHNKFTLMLGALDELGFIEYKGGYTIIKNNKLSIQLVFD